MMQKDFILRDLKGFSCLSYFLSVSTTKGVSVLITGNRENEDKLYCELDYENKDNSIRLHESSLLTFSEPVTISFKYPDNLKCQIQVNTDAIMSSQGKSLIN